MISIKLILKKTPLHLLWKKYWQIKDYYTRPIIEGPSSNSFKHEFLISFAQKNKIKILVETGTFLGEMIEAAKKYFDEIYSIEIDSRLYKISKKRFKKNKNVFIKKGDSSLLLPKIIRKINNPAIFWLDAHYSGGVTAFGEKETPIEKELSIIFGNFIKGSIILIDDARLFERGAKDYPSIIKLDDMIKKNDYSLKLKIENDIIVIC